MAGEILEATNGVNWTVVWSVIAVAVPACFAALIGALKIFGVGKVSKEFETKLDNQQKTIDENKANCEKLKKEIESKSEKNLSELKISLVADKETIDEIKTEISRLDKDLSVLQSEQCHNAEDFREIKESYRDMTNKMENIVQKLIEFVSSD